MRSQSSLLLLALLFCAVWAVPSSSTAEKSKDDVKGNAEPAKDFPPIVIPVFAKEDMNERLIPIGSAPPARGNRTGRFFGVTTGASGNNLQLGISFIVPFLNIPFGGLGSSSSSYYGSNYATTPGYGTSTTSLLGLNSGSIIFAVVIGIAAIIIIPFLIYMTTGVSTSPFGRSDNIQDMLSNLAVKVDDALQQYNIDAPSCFQRAVCTYVKTSSKRMMEGAGGSSEKIIEGLATNEYINTILDGTKMLEAINEARKTTAPCHAFYIKCPYNINSIYGALSQYATMYGQSINSLDPQNNAVPIH